MCEELNQTVAAIAAIKRLAYATKQSPLKASPLQALVGFAAFL
jgi:hypothetical protein